MSPTIFGTICGKTSAVSELSTPQSRDLNEPYFYSIISRHFSVLKENVASIFTGYFTIIFIWKLLSFTRNYTVSHSDITPRQYNKGEIYVLPVQGLGRASPAQLHWREITTAYTWKTVMRQLNKKQLCWDSA